MSLSEICVQQHEHEQNNLKRLLLWGLLGSLGVHGIALSLSQFKLWQDPPDELTPIELIVAEPQTKPLTEEPVKLSTQTIDPAAATASAPPRAAVAAPAASVAPPIEQVALDRPEPLEESQAESALEESQPAVDPEAVATEPTESQSESLRDLLQLLRESQAGSGTSSDAAPSPSATAGGGTLPNASAGARPGVVAARSTSNGRGQGEGSRTVACQNCVRPSYPQSALAARVEGQPKVQIDINPDGSVRSVTLTRSSGNAAIDQAAIQAARRSRFRPVSGGASVPIEYDLTIEGSRRHRDARRRGERQAVNLAPDPAATTETAPPSATASPSAFPAPSGSGSEPSLGRESVPAASSEPTSATPAVSEPATPPAAAPAPPPAPAPAPVPAPAPAAAPAPVAAPAPAPAPAAPSFSAPAPAAESPAEP